VPASRIISTGVEEEMMEAVVPLLLFSAIEVIWVANAMT
jgi:hypothetical protein